MNRRLTNLVVLVKGGGEVASAVAHKLARAHFRVCLTEIRYPQAISRGVAFCEAVYDREKEVEGIVAKLTGSAEEVPNVWKQNKIPILVDPEASVKDFLHPDVLVDAIMAKRNIGTKITDAPLVIGLGPGFQVNRDVHVVIETNYYSANLGKVILQGKAEDDTSIPVDIGGFTFARVLHAPIDGVFSCNKNIGDTVSAGEIIASVEEIPLKAELSGILRALFRSGVEVKKGTKLGEIDPVGTTEVCYGIRPKMRLIAGGVLEAILMHYNR